MTTRYLHEFIQESNRIEGIFRYEVRVSILAHEDFLSKPPTVESLAHLVKVIAGAELRDRAGLNVRVGNHVPPRGGPTITAHLQDILDHPTLTPYQRHLQYERVHPFTDGNGRSGRALWAWQMLYEHGDDALELGFLHRFYYQALSEEATPEGRDSDRMESGGRP